MEVQILYLKEQKEVEVVQILVMGILVGPVLVEDIQIILLVVMQLVIIIVLCQLIKVIVRVLIKLVYLEIKAVLKIVQ